MRNLTGSLSTTPEATISLIADSRSEVFASCMRMTTGIKPYSLDSFCVAAEIETP